MGVCFPSPANSVVVLVDVQEKLSAVMADMDSCRAKIAATLKSAGLLGVRIVVTEQYPKGLGPTLLDLTECIPEAVEIFDKESFSCWGNPRFEDTVAKAEPEALVLVGIEAHVCVQQTAIEALQRGYRVIVPADAVSSRSPTDKALALSLMRERGVVVTTVESLLFDWLETSRHPSFRDISRLIV